MTARTVDRLFKRMHADGIMTDFYPEDYKFYSAKPKDYDLAAGAMRWNMLHRDYKGPTVSSKYTVNDCVRGPLERCDAMPSVVEISPLLQMEVD